MLALPGRTLALLVLLTASLGLSAQTTARWIWSEAEGERHVFETSFTLPEGTITHAVLRFAADNHAQAWLNGHKLGTHHDWQSARRIDVRRRLKSGNNQLAFRAWNDSGPAGLLAELVVAQNGSEPLRITSGRSWVTLPDDQVRVNPTGGGLVSEIPWKAAKELGAYGIQPWGRITWPGEQQFQALPGFAVERIAEAPGSLIALTGDPLGRLYVSVERGSIHRLEDLDRDGHYEKRSELPHPVRYAQGLCWHDGALYAVGQAPAGTGLFRLEEEGKLTTIGLFRKGGGEHGAHGVISGPDGRLWVTIGNHTRLLETPASSSPHRDWYETPVLPRIEDPRGHARGIRAPGGVVLSVDPTKKDWHIEAGGFRNTYDIAFSAHGELFGYDSDMEWDLGLPWYRPTALYHVVPGGEYGWRTGAGKWPWELPDVLPPAIEVGRGSPTGLVLYDGTSWPAAYQGALLGADWSCGRIVAFRLERSGLSFEGTVEELLHGRPLNVTDLFVEASCELLFTTGGRGTEGALFRLRWTGETEAAGPPVAGPSALERARATWSSEEILAGLVSKDRWERYLAARKVESLKDASELEGALPSGEERLLKARHIVRAKDEKAATRLLAELLKQGALLADADATVEQRLLLLRTIEVVVVAGAEGGEALEKLLLPVFPSGVPILDRRMALLLGRCGKEQSLAALTNAMEREASTGERIHLALCASAVSAPWTKEQSEQFLAALKKAQFAPGGASHVGYLKAIAKRAEPNFEDDAREASIVWRASATPTVPKVPEGLPKRDRDRTFTLVQRLLQHRRRSAERGALVFRQACAPCHRIGLEGARVGPDLTTVVQRLSQADVLTAIMDPSRDISDQYRSFDVWTKGGELHSGALVSADDRNLVLLQSDGKTLEVPVAEVEERRESKTSIMPTGLLDARTPEEIADLFTFLGAPDGVEALAVDSFRTLFDGKAATLAGASRSSWIHKDGQLIGECLSDSSGFLRFGEQPTDFLLEAEVLLESGAASFVFRAVPEDATLKGYRARLGGKLWGSLDCNKDGRMIAPSDPTIWGPELQRGGWNHVVVRAKGGKLRVEINGITTAVTSSAPVDRGRELGIQLEKKTRLRLRSLRLRTP